MRVRILPPVPFRDAVVVVQRPEPSDVTRDDVGSNPTDHPNEPRRVGRVRLIAAVSKTARAVQSPPGFKSQTLLHALVDQAVEAGLLNRAVGVQVLAGAPVTSNGSAARFGRAAALQAEVVGVRISPDPPRGCRLRAGLLALTETMPVQIRPALPTPLRGAEAAPGSHKPRDLGSIPGHATKHSSPGVAQQPEQRSDTPPAGGASPPPRTISQQMPLAHFARAIVISNHLKESTQDADDGAAPRPAL